MASPPAQKISTPVMSKNPAILYFQRLSSYHQIGALVQLGRDMRDGFARAGRGERARRAGAASGRGERARPAGAASE